MRPLVLLIILPEAEHLLGPVCVSRFKLSIPCNLSSDASVLHFLSLDKYLTSPIS